MSKKGVSAKVRKLAESVAEDLNYELVDIEFVKEYSEYFLRVYIYKDNGINLDDCQKMSEILSDQLDIEDPIDVSYYLEVSSPGLDRPLKTDRDLERNLGKEVDINLYKSLAGSKDLERNLGKEVDINLYKSLAGSKDLQGFLESYNNNDLILRTESSEIINIPREMISLIKLSVKF